MKSRRTKALAYTPEEDALIIEGYEEGRAKGQGVKEIFEGIAEVLENRTVHGVEMRYYNLKSGKAVKVYDQPQREVARVLPASFKDSVASITDEYYRLFADNQRLAQDNERLKENLDKASRKLIQLENDQRDFAAIMMKARELALAGKEEVNKDNVVKFKMAADGSLDRF